MTLTCQLITSWLLGHINICHCSFNFLLENRDFSQKINDLDMTTDRSSHQRCSTEKGVLKKFAKFTGKRQCRSLFFNKVTAGLMPATLLKKRLRHTCFPVNFTKFLRTHFLQDTSKGLLLFGTHPLIKARF